MSDLPKSWALVNIEDTLLPFENGQTLRQGWSPQCERYPAPTENDWGVLKTTAIQDGEFQSEHNKKLPSKLEPDPLLEVEQGDLLLTCAGRQHCENRRSEPIQHQWRQVGELSVSVLFNPRAGRSRPNS